tara:strand:- start:45 stop:347 length:303 start_codon:yes stop_codon:yes gene_type:complete
MSNYTPAMIAQIQAAAPLDLAKAKALAADFGNVSHRSVISKAKHLDLEYVVASKAAKQIRSTRSDLVDAIAKAVDMPVDDLNGLANAKTSALTNLLANIS